MVSKVIRARNTKELNEQNGKPCPFCFEEMIKGHPKLMPTRDHIRARSRTGVRRENGRIIIICLECNSAKAHYTLNQFRQMLELRNKQLLRELSRNMTRIRNLDYYIRIGLEE